MNDDNNGNVRACPMCANDTRPGDAYCGPCRAAYLKARRYLGLQTYDSNAATKARRDKVKALAIASKGGSCERCMWTPKGPHEYAAIHFHHPDRDRRWSTMGIGNRSQAAILAEVARCEMLCANCHTLEHTGKADDKPGRPRKPVDELTLRWMDKLRAPKG